MKKYYRLYVMFLAQYLKSLMEYRLDFFIGLFGFLLRQTVGITFLFLIFQRIPDLNGWNFNQIVFIYGFYQLPRGLDHLLTDNLWTLSGEIIVQGKFDRYLLRPINPLFHLIAEVFQPDALGEILVGIALLITATVNLGLTFSLLDILIFILVLIFATIIYTSVKLFFASFAFWIKYSQAILFMNYSISEFAKYPISIYGKWLQKILTYILPFGFTAFFPAGYFVGKVDLRLALGGALIAAITAFTIAYTTWCKGINAYESAGN